MADSEQYPAEEHPRVNIEKELRQSYLEYSLSVIIGRAIPDARDGLNSSDLVVRGHYGNERGVAVYRGSDILRADYAVAVGRYIRDFKAPPLKFLAGVQHGGVFCLRGNDPAFAVTFKRGKNCQIVAFRAAAREKDLFGHCTQSRRALFTRLDDGKPSFASGSVRRGRVREVFGKKRQGSLQSLRVNGRACRVVKIDHFSSAFLRSRRYTACCFFKYPLMNN